MKNWKETDKQTAEYHRKIAVLAVAGICLLAGSPVMAAETEDLTLEQRVAQLFFVTPDQLSGVDGTTVAGEITKAAFKRYPVGGIILMENNIQSEEQVKELTAGYQLLGSELLDLPVFIGVDEEGGRVARIANAGIMDTPHFSSMYEVGASGNPQEAYQVGKEIGAYLTELGIDTDFAPVADVWSNAENQVIGDRSFGTDSEKVAEMVTEAVRGFHDSYIRTAVKHFPGHGNTAEDSHSGFAYNYGTKEELENREWKPFAAGIKEQSEFVMVGHICCPNIISKEIPASLSKKLVTDVLRNEMEFNGIIITDAMDMGAVTAHYSCGEAAVQAVEAGADMILMPENFQEAYEAVLQAVTDGRISEKRLNESVSRILDCKKSR